jgi:hypothetical protein
MEYCVGYGVERRLRVECVGMLEAGGMGGKAMGTRTQARSVLLTAIGIWQMSCVT